MRSQSNRHPCRPNMTSLDAVLAETDVLYVTRVQKERFEDPGLSTKRSRALL